MVNALRARTDEQIKEVRAEFKDCMDGETEDRRREYNKLEVVLEGFRTVSVAVSSVGEGIKHLGERFDDNRRSTDRAFDEIKHAMRSMDNRMVNIAQENISAR